MMWPGLAGRLSRALVGCHPRRWRERYGEEMLDVLDQHHPTAQTVASLAASVLSTHVDPAYRTEVLSLSRLRRAALVSAAIAAPIVLVSGLLLGYATWKERWHLSGAGGVGGVAFGPGRHLLVSAVGGASQDSMDTVWDVTDPARPRQLSAFLGGEPTALSPDGRIVATVSFDGQPVLWNVANPRRPARIAMMQAGGTAPLWGEAFSPDGQILAVAYTDRIFLWDVASAARPRLWGALAAPVTSAGQASFTPQDITFSPDGRILASVTGTGQVTVWNVTDPARAARIATLTGSRDYVQAIALSPRGTLVAGVTYHGTVLVFSLADPGRPALTATISGIMAHALYPDGLLQHPDAPPCPSCSPASYAAAFTPDGRTLTVVVARQEGNVTTALSHAARDTVFTWNVTSSGAVSGVTIASRNVEDSQPALAPNGRTVADGSPTSNAVYLWTPP
jgi:WD40 repeat protein